jgi:hypothetical protein
MFCHEHQLLVVVFFRVMVAVVHPTSANPAPTMVINRSVLSYNAASTEMPDISCVELLAFYYNRVWNKSKQPNISLSWEGSDSISYNQFLPTRLKDKPFWTKQNIPDKIKKEGSYLGLTEGLTEEVNN